MRRVGDHLGGGRERPEEDLEERIPATMVWVWGADAETRKACGRCQLDRTKLVREPMPGHSCGSYPQRGPILKAANVERRREAMEMGECPECHDAGYVWTYAPGAGERVVESGGKAAAFRDQRGTRWLVGCRRCRGNASVYR
jgi:hypothetical protein